MTEQRNQLAELFAACWKDDALKARFMSDPKAVLAEYDMPVPDGMDVKVVETADNCVPTLARVPSHPAPASPGSWARPGQRWMTTFRRRNEKRINRS